MIDVDEPFLKKSLKNVDASSLPPCEVELKQHILRAHYITNIWLNAHKTIPTDLIATECGWLEDLDESGEKSYKFKWFDGPQLPETIRDVVVNDETDNEDDEIEYESDTNVNIDENDSCSDYCASDEDF